MPPSPDVVDRIRKLLALSTSSNPHEAALAAERALAIAQRHNLDLSRIGGPLEGPFVERAYDVGGAAQWRWLLMSAIARAHFCCALRRWAGGRSQAQMFLLGEPHNVAVCGFLYEYLRREIDRLADRGWRRASYVYGEHVEARAWKRDFRRGAVLTIGDRLRERGDRFAEESAESRALVVAKDAALERELARRYGRVETTRVRFRGDALAFGQGQRAGREIALSTALDRAAGPTRPALPTPTPGGPGGGGSATRG